MIRSSAFACAILAVAASARAAPLPPDLPVAERAVLEDRYPARRIAFPNGAIGLPDLVYAQPPGYRPLTLDVYLPPAGTARPPAGYPLVLFIHGGGWAAGHSRQSGALADFPGVLAALAARGYVVASLNYRLSGEAPFPAAELDVKTAIRWLRARAGQYGMDPARAVVWGGSAGGHLAGLAAVTCGVPALDPTRQASPTPGGGPSTPNPLAGVSDCVQGAVTWYGVFDFATIAEQAHKTGSGGGVPRPFLGCRPDEACTGPIRAASPVDYVDRTDPPMLLIAGDADRTVPYLQSVEMADRLKAAGVPEQLILIPGVDHSFIGKTPDATRAATLRAVAATFDFIDHTVGQSRP